MHDVDNEPTTDGAGAVPAPTGETMACWDGSQDDADEACMVMTWDVVLP